MFYRNSIAFILLGCTVWSIHSSPVPQEDFDPPKHLWDQKTPDMRLTPEQLEETKSGITDTEKLWPGGVVIYRWDPNWNTVPDSDWIQEKQDHVRQAMDAISTGTCITFKEYTGNNDFFINIKLTNAVECSSSVGRANFGHPWYKNSEITLTTKDYCINDIGAITHEFIHTLGFWHEQQRPDRDQYITMFPENYNGDQSTNFGIQPGTKVYGTPYDFKSIMHYGPITGVTLPGKPAFAVKAGAPFDGTYIGQTAYLTKYDRQKINKMYEGLCP